MGRKQYTEEQAAFALRQAESGTPVAEIIRRLGVSEQTFYRWKQSSQVLALPSCDGFGPWKKRTGS
jgi:transposase-like protein